MDVGVGKVLCGGSMGLSSKSLKSKADVSSSRSKELNREGGEGSSEYVVCNSGGERGDPNRVSSISKV